MYEISCHVVVYFLTSLNILQWSKLREGLNKKLDFLGDSSPSIPLGDKKKSRVDNTEKWFYDKVFQGLLSIFYILSYRGHVP